MLLQTPPPSSYERRQLWLCAACAILSLTSMIVSFIATEKYVSAFRDAEGALNNPGNLTEFMAAFSILFAIIIALVILRETARIKASKRSRYLCLPLTGLILHLLTFLGLAIAAVMFLALFSLSSDMSEWSTECKGRIYSVYDTARYAEHSDSCQRQYDEIARIEIAGYALLLIACAVHALAGILSAVEIHRVRKGKETMSGLRLKSYDKGGAA